MITIKKENKMIKQISIFDLDGTTIDSSHRQNTDSKGNLDLNKWLLTC